MRQQRTGPGGGFTLVELLVAMFITVLLGTVIVMAYNTSMQSYYRTEKQLQALAAFRNTADRLEREVNSMVFKASVYPHPVITRNNWGGHHQVCLWDTRMKYLHGDAWVNGDPYPWIIAPNGAAANSGNCAPTLAEADWWKVNPNGKSLYQINFRPRYMGYYSSLDGFTIDRTEWYFNPPEERQNWADGLDNDADDPYGDGGLRILYDDRGCLMFRKKFDKDMLWREWNLLPDGTSAPLNEYRDPFHGPYSGYEFPPADRNSDGVPDELVGPIMKLWDGNNDGTKDNIDTGTVIGENFSDLRFHYLYKLRTSDEFIYADWWPWDNDSDPTNANTKDPNMPKIPITCFIGGQWVDISGTSTGVARTAPPQKQNHNLDICYFSLPMAISVRFSFTVGGQKHIYEKLIYLHASRWLKYLNP